MESPHVLLLPLPFQGHIMPLMEMAHHLIDAGFIVTFVNNEFNHHRLLSANPDYGRTTTTGRLHLLGIPDGMGSDEDRNDLSLMCKLLPSSMSPGLESIIKATAVEGRPIQWILADPSMAWALPLAKQMGLRGAIFWPSSTAMSVTMFNIPKLIEIGVIDEDGLVKKDENFRLAAGMPTLPSMHLIWNLVENSTKKSMIFSYFINNNGATVDHAEFIICNTFMDLEPHALSLIPSAIPIGPFFPAKHHSFGHLWPPANSTNILKWLDSHSPDSVLYIAFGSHTTFDKAQVDELAHGLEITGRPFLWAVRPDLTSISLKTLNEVFSTGFLSRVKDRALLVGWAPQQLVLAHPSIGCFMSHCGWNSTLEGVRNGIRFVCWPYFGDQFLNQSYICDIWRIGVRVGQPNENEKGGLGGRDVDFISRERIRERVEEAMRDDDMRERALLWKKMALKSVSGGGSSHKNFMRIIDIMKSNI